MDRVPIPNQKHQAPCSLDLQSMCTSTIEKLKFHIFCFLELLVLPPLLKLGNKTKEKTNKERKAIQPNTEISDKMNKPVAK